MLITDHLKDRNAPERNLGRPAEPRVLIADDQADVLEALRLLLKAEGFHLETASSRRLVSSLRSKRVSSTWRSST
jgi:PleD family two-component response regulator